MLREFDMLIAMVKEKTSRIKKITKEFRDFAVKGNAIELAIGVVIGAAFRDIVDVLVSGIIMPPISLLTGKVDFTNMYWNITGDSAMTLAEAEEAGEIIVKYGEFLNTVINFLIIALVIFIVVRQLNRLHRREEEKKQKEEVKKCEFCFEKVHKNATRCPHCTSVLKK